MKMTVKNMPRLELGNLLRRRKMSLKQFIDEHGITTYEGLAARCSRMGVVPPDVKAFNATLPPLPVNNPTEGVVVIEPMRIIAESGAIIADDVPPVPPVAPFGPTEDTQKKTKKKKDEAKANDA